MPICSYLVIPAGGASEGLAARLAALPGCDVGRAENTDLLLLVTETEDPESDERLRSEVEGMAEVHALVLTFGEVDPDTPLADPVQASRRRRPGLPVLGADHGPGNTSPAMPSSGPGAP
jgi:nitrate reductase NapAB chaperone NapD